MIRAPAGALKVVLKPCSTVLADDGSLATIPGRGHVRDWVPARLNDHPSALAAAPVAVAQESTV